MTDPLWTPADLAAFLCLSRATISTLSSRSPDRLPPRVTRLSAPRWVPEVCQAWVLDAPPVRRKGGRPRG